ncbi:hypothetical protein C1Y63_10100 [Corynebacterium sp. 13CS0277]|uniref:SURF1 family cytochrome oxidase biogenesis protein n=1 Tax=Corynebacterium sp. 13CS0277 TaxID=2071994 RepID=UPI000D02B4E5|nr:SURF1 family protein [Corynebacterium sp. 13CS0277]PRQ10719.1 hypothetical protein C1Y63_10100 [Corynebacterium sp. 13CS0277]
MRAAWRTFLKPGWVITAVAVIGFAYLAFTVLAPWQLGKNARTAERNHNIEAAFERAPIDAAEAFGPSGGLRVDEWTRVTLHGHYVDDAQVLVRMRPLDGQQAYQSLVPFVTDGGLVLMLNRGFVPATPNVAPQLPAPPSGEVTVTGFARHTEGRPTTPAVERDGFQQVAGISTHEVAELLDQPLGTDYVQLAADQPGGLTAIPLPQLEPGPYLSYGIQWIAFGIMAPLALVYFVRAELKERREDAAGTDSDSDTAADSSPEAQLPAAPEDTPAHSPSADDLPAAAPQPQQRRARRARYGNRPDHYKGLAEEERF